MLRIVLWIDQVCATKCWTQQTAQNMRRNCSARTAMAVNSDQKDTDSVVVPVLCPWTQEPNSKTSKYSSNSNSYTSIHDFGSFILLHKNFISSLPKSKTHIFLSVKFESNFQQQKMFIAAYNFFPSTSGFIENFSFKRQNGINLWRNKKTRVSNSCKRIS